MPGQLNLQQISHEGSFRDPFKLVIMNKAGKRAMNQTFTEITRRFEMRMAKAERHRNMG